MQCLRLDRDIHHVADLPLTHFIQREFSDPTLMTYRHAESLNWVVGYWINQAHGVIRELLIIGRSPAAFTRHHVERLRKMLRGGPSTKELQGLAREQERQFLETQLETQELWNSQKRFLRRNLPGVAGDHPALRGP